MIVDGLFIGYKILRIEKYIQPVKIIQCFNCQKFGHVATNCKATETICVKCSGNHKVKDCVETTTKCANCRKEHASSYGGCPYKQAQIKEKQDKINSKATSASRSYSSVVSQNNVNSVGEALKNIEKNIENKLNIINKTIQDRLDEVEKTLIKSIDDKINSTLERKSNIMIRSIEEKINTEMQSIQVIQEEIITNKTNNLRIALVTETNIVFYMIDVFRLVSISIKNFKFVFISYYNPPQCHFSAQRLMQIQKKFEKLIICGDFNAKTMNLGCKNNNTKW